MVWFYIIVSFLLGLLLGMGFFWFFWGRRWQRVWQEEFRQRVSFEEKLSALQKWVDYEKEQEKRATDAFKSISHDLFQFQTQNVMRLLDPFRETLQQLGKKVDEIEKARIEAYGSLSEYLKNLSFTQMQLQKETSRLVTALRAPQVRGRWGEIQLQRVVELAGMVEYCDFISQDYRESGDDKLKPDMVIKLPAGRVIVVDSKCPIAAFLDALETEDEIQKIEKLKDHARQVKTHILKLSQKSYWEAYSQQTPEFVVLFIPRDNILSAALEQDTYLIEFAAEKRVIIATPTTLIALLRAVAYGWRQEQMTQHAAQVSRLGDELLQRIRKWLEYFMKIGSGLEQAVQSYNQAVGSLESRVLVTLRKLKDYGVNFSEELQSPELIEKLPKALEFEFESESNQS